MGDYLSKMFFPHQQHSMVLKELSEIKWKHNQRYYITQTLKSKARSGHLLWWLGVLFKHSNTTLHVILTDAQPWWHLNTTTFKYDHRTSFLSKKLCSEQTHPINDTKSTNYSGSWTSVHFSSQFTVFTTNQNMVKCLQHSSNDTALWLQWHVVS